MEVQRKYVYDGPVEAFGRYISRMWSGTTTAPTAEKARANLIFQFKKNSITWIHIPKSNSSARSTKSTKGGNHDE